MPAGLANEALTFLQVLFIDVVLAGDNALVVGLAAAGLPPSLRARAVLLGTAAAVVLRIALSFLALRLLAVVGLTLAGGLLLLWVCWKLGREVLALRPVQEFAGATAAAQTHPGTKTIRAAVVQIVAADASMSLDNVLAVAGAAREHPAVMAVGLVVSVALMGTAAALIAGTMERHRWLAWIGVGVVLVVALRMVVEGGVDVGGTLLRLR